MDATVDRLPHGFRDRAEAGRMLTQLLAQYAACGPLVVGALPRGGVPVGWEIAAGLHAPLDIIVVLKISTEQQPELALGAIADGGFVIQNDEVIARLGLSASAVEAAIATKRERIANRVRSLRGDRAPIDLTGTTVILVDDGLATGASMQAAIAAVRDRRTVRIVVAVPVASREAAHAVGRLADDFVAVTCPASFMSVGNWYRSFAQVCDEDVRSMLDRASRRQSAERMERPT